MINSKLVVVAVALALSGCVVSRVDPKVPELALPEALPEQAVAAPELPNPWWSIFQDPTLDKLVEEALAHNPDVQIAAARVDEARALLRITNADRVPFLNVEGTAVRSKDPSFLTETGGLDRHQTLYTVQGVVGYELDLWGRYQRASQSARLSEVVDRSTASTDCSSGGQSCLAKSVRSRAGEDV